MRRAPALLTLLALLAVAGLPASAHVAPRLRIASPEDGARVYGDTVRVVVAGEGGDGPGLFTLALDGTLVDATGKVGGTFTTLSVQPGGQTVLNVPVTPGEHELRLVQPADPDAGTREREVVTRFTVTADAPGNGLVPVLAVLVVAGGVVAAVAVRRRAAAAGSAAEDGEDAAH